VKAAAKPANKAANQSASRRAKSTPEPSKKSNHKAVARPTVKLSARPAAPPVAEKTKPDRPDKARQKGKAVQSVKPVNGSSRTTAGLGWPAAAVVRPGESSNGPKPAKLRLFSSRELESFRDLLLAKRRELIGDMSAMEREALRTSGASNLSNLPIHMADMGTDNYEQEFTLGLVQKDRELLKEINLALAKLQNGTFGLCEGTGQPINKSRLEYQPWARYSVEHQRKMERHGR
jgi:RNA polymerase-binding transcription factor DksA